MSIIFTPSANARAVSAGSLRRAIGSALPSDVNFGIGEPGFATPQPLVDAFRQADLFDHPGYGDFNGQPELREEIANQAARPHFARDPEHVIVTSGATSGIAATILAVAGPGDRVLIPSPTYSLYADAVNLAGAIPVFIPLRDDFQLDLDAIAEQSQSAKLLILCNPGNPTGVVLDADSLHKLGVLLEGSNILVLADEAYSAFDYEGGFTSALDIPSLSQRLIYAQTFSKTFSMTGWRVGYVIGPPEAMPWIRQVHRGMIGAINRSAQSAALAALRLGPQLVSEQVQRMRSNRDLVVKLLRQIDGITLVKPDGAFYAFFRYPFDMPSVQLAAHLRERGVVVRAGREFGPDGEGCLRLAYAVEQEQIVEGIARIRAAFKELSDTEIRIHDA